MPAKFSKLLVIDASVARGAGKETSTATTAKICQDFLKAVRELRYRIVMTPDIKEEWDKHASSYAVLWRSSMLDRSLLEYLPDVPKNNELNEVCKRLADNDGHYKAMAKDFRLIEAALVADKIIVSPDKKARRSFSRAAQELEAIADIVWVNPNVEEEQSIVWLENGAEPEKERCLGFSE